MNDEEKIERLRNEHLLLVQRIYDVCKRIDYTIKLTIGAAILGILIGSFISFNLFLILYSKGLIQRWFI